MGRKCPSWSIFPNNIMRSKIKEILSKCNNWHLVIVGAGGTGSNLVPHLSQLMFSYANKQNISAVLVDEDVVEKKNIGRQFFIEPNIGENKAKTLQTRYRNAWDVDISYFPYYVREKEMLVKLLKQGNYAIPILVGCVDNNVSRQVFHQAFEEMENLIYLDAGNSEFAGQVVMGMKYKGETLLKPVASLYPDILDSTDGISVGGTCGQMVEKVPQSLVANMWAMVTLLSFINNIVGLKDVAVTSTTFNAHNVISKPEYA